MSALPRAKRMIRATELYTGRSTHDGDTFEEERRKPAKRCKITQDKEGKPVFLRARVKGKLSNLPQMPLDILFEIFGYLDPLDVLRLARTTKAFRSVLMTRSATSLWKTAFENTPDVPQKPEGLAEPSWANFLFTTNCYVLASHLALHTASVVIKSGTVSNVLVRRKYSGVWLKVDFDNFMESFAKVRGDQAKSRDFCKQRNKRYAKMAEHSKEYDRWAADNKYERSADLEHIRNARFELIKMKLIEAVPRLGPEIGGLTSSQEFLLRQLPPVKAPRPLTDRAWPKVEREITPIMTEFRDARLVAERAAILKKRRQTFAEVIDEYASTQPVDAILPSAADIYVLQSFSPIKQRLEEDPNDTDYPPSAFDDVLENMPQYCAEWMDLCTERLLEVVDESSDIENADPPILPDKTSLSLATTIFYCKGCFCTLGYPNILVHQCFRRPPTQLRHGTEMGQSMDDLNIAPWIMLSPYRINLVSPMLASDVVLACGYDPQNATAEELDSANVWLVGEFHGKTTKVMRWRKAIQRTYSKLEHVYPKPQYNWSKVTDESLREAYERAELEFYTTNFSKSLVCSHCSIKLESSALVEHMKQHKPDGATVQMSDFLVDPSLTHKDLFSLAV
ncbi:hypothetical protein ONZ45_g3364 [Pleurotus djamor]|nr:hypothetical protein ONZ45_g3364 [Pleurotus djamor]